MEQAATQPTLRESLTKMLENLTTPGRLAPPGGCKYSRETNDANYGKPCIIGSLMPKPLLDEVLSRNLNNKSINYVAHNVDYGAVESALGMKVRQAMAIQALYDDSGLKYNLIDAIKEVLEMGSGFIGTEYFRLEPQQCATSST